MYTYLGLYHLFALFDTDCWNYRIENGRNYFPQWKFARLQISVKFILMGTITIEPALIQIMAWRRTGDKPLSEPMLASSVNVLFC